MDIEAARKVVSELGWLSQQPEEFHKGLLSRTELKSYAKGQYLYHLDDLSHMMFGVVKGAVLIGVAHPTLGLYQAHLGRPGEWYGEDAAMQGASRLVAVEACVPTHILCLPTEAVLGMLKEQPLWYRNISALLLWNLERAVRTATDLLITDPNVRVRARLLTLCGYGICQDFPDDRIELPLTQDQFAMMCGLSRKSVHLSLHRLESEGLCENRYGGIVVPSAEALEKSLLSLGSRSES